MGGTPVLQNVRYGDTQGVTEGEHLDGEGEPHSSQSQYTQLPEVHSGAGTLSVHMPPSWPVVCPVGIHQRDEARCDLMCQKVQMIVYIDDILLMADTAAQAVSHLEALTFLQTGLGFIINVQKSITTPTQQIEFLCLKVDSVSLYLSLPGEKVYHIRMEVRQHLQRPQVTA